MNPPLLAVSNLDVAYQTPQGPLKAVNDVGFTIAAGEVVGVVGESGCGKSTLATAVMGLLGPTAAITAGSVSFRGRELTSLSENELRRLWGEEISMVFQDPGTSLNPVLSIEQQMMTPLRERPESRGKTKSELRNQAVSMLHRVGIPDAERRIKSYPHEFSGGMRQRVMIAMALLSNPALLIADEPTSALDVTLKQQINDLLLGLRDELGTSILYISHDLGIVAQVCDRVLVMYAGEIVESGSTTDIFRNPRHPYTRALLAASPSAARQPDRLTTIPGQVPSLADMPSGCRFADRCSFSENMCRAGHPELFAVGNQDVRCYIYTDDWPGEYPVDGAIELPAISVEANAAPAAARETIVQASNLSVHFTERALVLDRLLRRPDRLVKAVDSVDLLVYEGEIVAVVGESGSGKTTLGRTILRLQEKTAGELIVAGNELATLPRPSLRAARAGMQMIFQDAVASLSPRLRVRELLLEPFVIHGRQSQVTDTTVSDLLEMVGLGEIHQDKYPHELSGGQARRVGIARALSLEPQLLIADEPTAGLDVSVGAGILNLLRQLNRDRNVSMILITHDMNIIRFMADRVAVMQKGQIVEMGPTTTIMDAPQHPYTQELLAAVAVPELIESEPKE